MCLKFLFSFLAIYLDVRYLFWAFHVIPLISIYFYHFIWQDLVKNWACSIYFVVAKTNIMWCEVLNFPQFKMPTHHFFLTYHHHKCTYSLGSFCSGLWPLSTIIWDYQIASFITGDTTNPQILQFPWQHCHIITVSLFFHSFHIIPVRFLADLGYFSIDDLNLVSFEGFPLAQGMFQCFTYC